MADNPWKMDKYTEWVAHMSAFEDAAKGAMRLCLIRRRDRAMLEAADNGDPLAIFLCRVISSALRQFSPTLECLICRKRFKGRIKPDAFVVWLPGLDKKDHHDLTVAQPICVQCCKMDDRPLMYRVLEELKGIIASVDVIEDHMQNG
jgi:hypothetical protein